MQPQPLTPNDFNTSLFECYKDWPSTVEAVFCPYCMVAQEYHMLDRKQRSIDWMMCGLMAGCDCFMCLGLALIIGNIITRAKLRTVFQLTNVHPVADCLASTVCCPFTVCQTYREMSLRSQWPGGICVSEPYRDPHFEAPAPPSMGRPQQGVALDTTQGYPAYYGQPPPNAGYPSYSGQPVTYGQPQSAGYGQPPSQYNGYGQPPAAPGYPPVSSGHAAPAPGYGHAAPAPGYGFAAPAPAPGYGQAPSSAGPPASYGQPQTAPQAPVLGYQGAPPQGSNKLLY